MTSNPIQAILLVSVVFMTACAVTGNPLKVSKINKIDFLMLNQIIKNAEI